MSDPDWDWEREKIRRLNIESGHASDCQGTPGYKGICNCGKEKGWAIPPVGQPCGCHPGVDGQHALVWFARTGTKRLGPFDSQVEASKAVMNSFEMPHSDAFVWPERACEQKKKSPYKDSVIVTGWCRGKAGETVELRCATSRSFQPHKLAFIESEENAALFTLKLANSGESCFPSGYGYVETSKFRENPLGGGIKMPNLLVGDAYIFSFKFEKDAELKLWFGGPALRDRT